MLGINADFVVVAVLVTVTGEILVSSRAERNSAKHEDGLRRSVAFTEREDMGPAGEVRGAGDGLGRRSFAGRTVVVVVELEGKGDIRGVGERRCGVLG